MNTKAIIFCVALAMCVQYSQARNLLVAANATTCADAYGPTCTTGTWNNFTTIENVNATDAQLLAACCLFTTETCFNVNCPAGSIKSVTANATAVINKTLTAAQAVCCKEAFTTETCTNLTTTKPVCAVTKAFKATVPLEGIAKDDTAEIENKCCVAIPVCDIAEPCTNVGLALRRDANVTTPDTEDARKQTCCVFPANATCENIKAATNMTLAVAFNCSADPNYAAKVIATAGSSPAINGKLAVEARTACCDALKYTAEDTCASVKFNCTENSLVVNATLANVTLEDVAIADKEATGAKCCDAPVVTIPVNDNTTDTTSKPRNSAGAASSAASFAVSALVLLAMLVL